MSEYRDIIIKLKKDYNEGIVDEILKSYEGKQWQLKKDFHFVRQNLYWKTKIMFLPAWIENLEYKEDLLLTHDMIIEECTGKAAYKLNDALLYKLNEMHKENVPLFILLKYFQEMKLTKRYTIDDILACFNYSFLGDCRKIFARLTKFKGDLLAGKIKILKELKE